MVGCWRALIISDTHNKLDKAVNLIRSLEGHIDAVYHMGDHIRDWERLQAMFPNLTITGVAGNCDYRIVENEKTLEVLGHRIYMCHGHQHGVKFSYNTLKGFAKRNQYDVALCGHTHIPFADDEPDLLLLNPGSIGEPRLLSGASYAVLYLEDGKHPEYRFGYTKEPVDAVIKFLSTRNS